MRGEPASPLKSWSSTTHPVTRQGSPTILQAAPFEPALRVPGGQPGTGTGHNLAIPLAAAPLVLFSGDNILPEEDFVEAHLAAHRRFPDETTAILGRIRWHEDITVNTVMKHIDGVGAEQFSYYYMTEEQVCDFRFFYTSNLSLKRSLLWAYETWFDPDYSLYGFEDIDLGYRLSRRRVANPLFLRSHRPSLSFSFRLQFFKPAVKSGKMASLRPEKSRTSRANFWPRFPDPLEQGAKKNKHPPGLISVCRTHFVRRGAFQAPRRFEVLALRLASFYEFYPNSFTDFFYSQVFEHFFHKGILEQMALEIPWRRSLPVGSHPGSFRRTAP